jgi:hypothetical protein
MNGSANRIKWRANDMAGNGPLESREYLVLVNTWQPPIKIPRISLWSPVNGSVLPAIMVKLSWELENQHMSGVLYDIYLDTKTPPKKVIQINETNTDFLVQQLENDQVYYWSVVPKYQGFNGTCISGIWWFKVDIPLPKVNLISPMNGSLIYNLKPTLIWSLRYQGSRKITYDLYLGTADNGNQTEFKFENLDTHFFYVNEGLFENTTYYWYIVPQVGKYQGHASEKWWFTIKSPDEDPSLHKLNLTIIPSTVILIPGGISNVTALVYNLGLDNETVSLEFKIPPDKMVGILVNQQNRLDLAVGNEGRFNLSVVATISAVEDEFNITMIAYSKLRGLQNTLLNSERNLTVIIQHPESNKKVNPENDFDFGIMVDTIVSFILPIIILMIFVAIVLLLAILANKRRKKEIAEDPVLETEAENGTDEVEKEEGADEKPPNEIKTEADIPIENESDDNSIRETVELQKTLDDPDASNINENEHHL